MLMTLDEINPLHRSALLYKDEGMNGFIIRFPEFIHENIFIKLISSDDNGILSFINYEMRDFFIERSDLPKEIIERALLQKLDLALEEIKKREDMIIETNNVIAFHICFINIHIFIEKYKNGYKHENKKIDKKFDKIVKVITKLMERNNIQ